MTDHTDGTTAQPGGPDAVEMVLHERHDRVGVERVVTGTVRVSRRIVTETRTVEVTVRREVLDVDPPVAPGARDANEVYDVDADQTAPSADPEPAGRPDRDLVLELYAEIPVISTRVVPTERVRIRVRTVDGVARVDTTTARERLEVDQA